MMTKASTTAGALARVRAHEFHPLDEDDFTIDRALHRHGIADPDDSDWRVRLLAIRDLVRGPDAEISTIVDGLFDADLHVRYVSAVALGIRGDLEPVDALMEVLAGDTAGIVRAATAAALGEIGTDRALAALQSSLHGDSACDVRQQAELAVDQVKRHGGATDDQRRAWRQLDGDLFTRVQAGERAPDFTLPDVDDQSWRLAPGERGEWVVLIWIFAHWCPVCHGEFAELMDQRKDFEHADVTVATIECHDRYRGRVMVGRELEPDYWFTDDALAARYREGVWWPHLLDRAGAVGARWGVDPMAFSVHSEYINRPATMIIDPTGKIRFAYVGTYWGDRPSIEQTLDMVREERFDFVHPERLQSP